MALTFVPGLELARQFYAEVVRPLLEQGAPGLRYSAALLGPGSEVLGFDSARSTDHDWGPRLQVFLGDASTDASETARIRDLLGRGLPGTFRGYPTRFELTGEPPSAARPQVRVLPLGRWLQERLGFDPRAGVTAADWLATPAQRLAEVTGGAVFHDGLGELGRPGISWPGIPATSGVTSWPASGAGSVRKNRSLAGAARPVTSWGQQWSRAGWPAT